MKKIEEIQLRKLMSSYGGVGSIIETKDNGSLKVDFYNRWNYFAANAQNNLVELRDLRLLHRLRTIPGFEDLEHLYSAPQNDLSDVVYNPRNRDLMTTIKSSYFPGWFFCPKCRRFHKYEDWRNLWNLDNGFSENPPACYHCSRQIGHNRIHRERLEQVRFLMASADTSNICDVPFDLLFGINRDGLAWILDGAAPLPPDHELFYRTSSSSDALQTIYVQDGANGQIINMAVINNRYLVYNNGPWQGAYKLFQRNQNNIYYPNVIKSLYIPWAIDENTLNMIINLSQNGLTADAIFNMLGLNPQIWSVDDVQFIIDNHNQSYDCQEFAYIIDSTRYRRNNRNFTDRYLKIVRYPNLSSILDDNIGDIVKVPFIRCLYAVHKLKETWTIPTFSRVAPEGESIQWWNTENGIEVPDLVVNSTPTYNVGLNRQIPNYLPAVEVFGEGLFLEVDMNGISREHVDVFVHTFSHMIMKELEFQCGYSLSSMQERIYHDAANTRYGLLIYTVGGADGSYGGFISLFPSDTNATTGNIVRIIHNAMERAEDCPNDPICSEEGGHCYACLDIPEISCCCWNNALDRNVFNMYYHNYFQNKSFLNPGNDVNVVLDD